MSDEFTEDEIEDLTEDQDDDSSTVKTLRRQLRKAKAEAKANGELAEAGKAAARKLALMDAGIDITTTVGKLFARSYDGELTAEAIKAAALEDGVIEEKKDEVSEEEAGALQRMSEVTSGGSQQLPKRAQLAAELDPRQLTREEFWAKARSNGLVREE